MQYFLACFVIGAQKSYVILYFPSAMNLTYFVLNQNCKCACATFTLSIFIFGDCALILRLGSST